MLVGLGCRTLGDEEAAALELDAARGVFAQLGATPDLARLEALAGWQAAADAHGLRARALQVLRLLAAGKTNHAIATDLILAEKTVSTGSSNRGCGELPIPRLPGLGDSPEATLAAHRLGSS